MKKTILFITFLTLLVACSGENSNSEDFDIKQQVEFSAKNFVNGTIAYEKNGEIKLGVTKDELLNSFNTYSTELKIGYIAKSYLIEEIDGENYVRFYHEDNDGSPQVSTVALIKNQKSIKDSSLTTYRTGKTLCTTTVCNNCCGCVPSVNYCTRCELDTLGCTRATSGETGF